MSFAALLSIVQILNAKSVNHEQKMYLLELHRPVLLSPKLTPYFISEKNLRIFYNNTSEYLDKIGEEFCCLSPVMLTFVDLKNKKLFLFAFYAKALSGKCEKLPLSEDNDDEIELYENPIFLSFHGSLLVLVVIMLTIFASIFFVYKKKSKKRVLKLRSETCYALSKLGTLSSSKDLTKVKNQSGRMEHISEEP